MKQTDTVGDRCSLRLGSLLLGLGLLGFIWYQVVLRPAAGFPSDEMQVILSGINTLRFGHALKFLEAVAVVWLTAVLYLRFSPTTPLHAQLLMLLGTSTFALLVASGILGWRILGEAEVFFAINPVDARSLILIRTVTIALFDGALLALGLWVWTVCWASWNSRARAWRYLGWLVGAMLLLKPGSELFNPISALWIWLAPALGAAWFVGLGWLDGVMVGGNPSKKVSA
ncbi:MAG: hypothetical protein N2318_11005 [Meiothermus sp.]|nr:hypothetical protein [Meiothermus sp.]